MVYVSGSGAVVCTLAAGCLEPLMVLLFIKSVLIWMTYPLHCERVLHFAAGATRVWYTSCTWLPSVNMSKCLCRIASGSSFKDFVFSCVGADPELILQSSAPSFDVAIYTYHTSAGLTSKSDEHCDANQTPSL